MPVNITLLSPRGMPALQAVYLACINFCFYCILPSMLLRCWLGGWKGIGPVKTEWWVAGVFMCLGQVKICIWPSWCHCYSLSLALVNPEWFYLPGFTFLVPARLDSPGKDPRGP